MNTLLSEEQRDALQELMNISMGQAANALARLISAKITLSIPKISAVTPHKFLAMLTKRTVWYTRQSFLGAIKGEVVAILSKDGCDAIALLMDYDLPLTQDTLNELLLELANILAGACLAGFAEQLSLKAKLSMPTIFMPAALRVEQYRWASTLIMEVEFKVEASHFDSKIVICLEEASVQTLLATLQQLLE
ncbi:chemotaxis protein CheC [Rheinheimera aquimaris]|uniref:Chemotaxis protein CheC n=1 Tax=Rheinheimera aquimaris TaxID=412437 RepID=A0ABN1DVY8_9GAMM|nr:chemotaxis protein CheX [Rheinheimera aquimaris]MCB5213993.1 chemotaxis protein CheC [Rheinheimera aquimaris]